MPFQIQFLHFAKAAGAEVTGVCSTRNIELAKSAGCDRVIDYKKEDFTKTDRKYGGMTKKQVKALKKQIKNSGIAKTVKMKTK